MPTLKPDQMTLQNYSRNDDGTFDGARMVQWLTEAVTRHPCSLPEARRVIREAYKTEG